MFMRWQWYDCEMTRRWLLDKFEMTMHLLYDDRSSHNEILFIAQKAKCEWVSEFSGAKTEVRLNSLTSSYCIIKLNFGNFMFSLYFQMTQLSNMDEFSIPFLYFSYTI